MEPAAKPAEPKRRGRILVVDDDAGLRALVTEVLEALGHDVQTASTGPEALACARAQPPDLVLLDMRLPELSGIEVCRQLRTDPRTRETRVIMMSGVAGRGGLEEGIIAGADDFLEKPINVLELTVRVRSMLRVRNIHDVEKRVEAYIHSLERLRQRSEGN